MHVRMTSFDRVLKTAVAVEYSRGGEVNGSQRRGPMASAAIDIQRSACTNNTKIRLA